MTNAEYEFSSVRAALASFRHRGEDKLSAVDKQIEQVEDALVFLLHERREIVNHYELNKPAACIHEWGEFEDGVPFCIDCGERR